jgi:hypothetical protein
VQNPCQSAVLACKFFSGATKIVQSSKRKVPSPRSLSAPTGRRLVATGGARPAASGQSATRGKDELSTHPPREGRRNCRHARRIGATSLVRATPSPRRRPAPPRRVCDVAGWGERKNEEEPLHSRSAFHGFRVGPQGGRAAPPAATFHGPVGGRKGARSAAVHPTNAKPPPDLTLRGFVLYSLLLGGCGRLKRHCRADLL